MVISLRGTTIIIFYLLYTLCYVLSPWKCNIELRWSKKRKHTKCDSHLKEVKSCAVTFSINLRYITFSHKLVWDSSGTITLAFYQQYMFSLYGFFIAPNEFCSSNNIVLFSSNSCSVVHNLASCCTSCYTSSTCLYDDPAKWHPIWGFVGLLGKTT